MIHKIEINRNKYKAVAATATAGVSDTNAQILFNDLYFF